MTELPETWRRAAREALALVSPIDCAGCGAPDVELCDACPRKLRPEPTVTALADGTPVVAALRYEGVVRDVVLEFKQRGRLRLARPLAPALREAVLVASRLRVVLPPVPPATGPRAVDDPGMLVVAAPSSASGRRRRGYDPVALLVARAGFGRPPRILRLRLGGGTQKRRDLDGRRTARVGTMICSRVVQGRSVIVVDDVMTSGGTLVEAVRAVSDAGGSVVACAVLAATPRASDARE